MKRTIALPLTVLVLLAAACTSDSSGSATTDGSGPGDTTITTDPVATDPGGTPTTTPSTDPTGGPIGFAAASLRQFDDCSAFVDHVHAEGVERVGPYGLGDNGFYGPDVFLAEDVTSDVADEAASEPTAGAIPATADPGVRTEGDGGSDGSFSTTNVQVDGVDEPDIVKSDGDRILAIAGETLHYIDIAADGVTGTARGAVSLNTGDRYAYGFEIFMAGDRAFVFAQGDGFFGGPVVFEGDIAVPAPDVVEPQRPADDVDAEPGGTEPGETEPGDAEESFAEPLPDDEPLPEPLPLPVPGPDSYVGPQTLIIEVDLSDPDRLTVANTMTVEGRYISARAIGDTARLVVTSPPQDLGFLYPSNPGTEDKAEEANRQVILDSTAEDWIPEYTLVGADGQTTTGQVAACSDIHAPADFSGFDMLSIVTLDLASGLTEPTGGAAVLAAGDTVYASQDRLYVSTNIWEPIIDEQTREWLDENYRTDIHRFSIAGDSAATYEASGSVDGHLLNQFSMNDRDGVFYAATTMGAPWTDSSESQIVALERNGDRLEQVGVVGGLGLGERIFSVRYVDDTAYVVTFRQTDPFYVVDLSDPRNMSVQGELKIPGFSSYLHPIGETLVLGVGQDATDEGRTTGTKVSLFDVSDPANPLELDVWTLPNASSDAEFDHRAFLWWAPTNTAVLPLQSYGDRFAGAVVLNIVDGSIVEQGRITHSDEDAGVVGQTDCRVLTDEEIGQDDGNDFFWANRDGGQVQACGPNDRGGAVGMYCNPIPLDEIEFYYWNGEVTIDDVIAETDADRIELCWPDWNGFQIAVQRAMVIDGNLWTLSAERLQSNDLVTLDRTAAIDL